MDVTLYILILTKLCFPNTVDGYENFLPNGLNSKIRMILFSDLGFQTIFYSDHCFSTLVDKIIQKHCGD